MGSENSPTEEAGVPRPTPGFVPRLLRSFALLYFVLYTHPFPLGYLPNPLAFEWVSDRLDDGAQEWIGKPYEWIGTYSTKYSDAKNAGVDWLARNAFEIERDLDRPRGSGDTTHNYLEILLYAIVSGLGAACWAGFGRRGGGLLAVGPWLHVAARYYLAFTMFGYGIIKVIMLQFGPPGFAQLVKPFGEATPMNLVWNFMGASQGYTMMSGAMEVLAAALLIWRRTAMLGAVVTFGVMANVAALNYFYDVPVKLFSSHLVAMAALLLVPDLRRLFSVFLANRPAPARDLSRPFARWRWPAFAAKLLILVPFFWQGTDGAFARAKQFGLARELPEHYGLWEVEQFDRDGEERPPLLDDPIRWRRFAVEYTGTMDVFGMDDVRHIFTTKFDDEAGTVEIGKRATWNYAREGESRLRLEGQFGRTPWRGFGVNSRPVDPQLAAVMRRVSEVPEELWARYPLPPPASDPSDSESAEEDQAQQSAADSSQAESEPSTAAEATTEADRDPDEVPLDPAAIAAEEAAAEAEAASRRVEAELLGVWEADTFDVIGDILNSRRDDPSHWQRLVFFGDGRVLVVHPDGQEELLGVELQPDDGTLTFVTEDTLQFERSSEEELRLHGEFRGHHLDIRTTRRLPEDFLLVRRGYHWINEIPLNR